MLNRWLLLSTVLTSLALSANLAAYGPGLMAIAVVPVPPPIGPYVSSRPFLNGAEQGQQPAHGWYPDDAWGAPSRPYVGPGRYWSPPAGEMPRRWDWGAEPVAPDNSAAGGESKP